MRDLTKEYLAYTKDLLEPFLMHLLRCFILTGAVMGMLGCQKKPHDGTLLNVSYDPTRELYGDFNTSFARHWKKTQH